MAIAAASTGGHENTLQILLSQRSTVIYETLKQRRFQRAEAVFRRGDRKGYHITQLTSLSGEQLSHNSQILQAKNAFRSDEVGSDEVDKDLVDGRMNEILNISLLAASLCGQSNILQILLECGAAINTQGGQYDNTLQAACSQGHDKIVQILL